eukprot:TRINITY_DN66972_c3_g1_i1.p1 TRINITY_DN66972_c3_g1~~TRINITY_DN66972_c3_g1_i1.p1  ORF type:complete len:467 (-),score=59.77 TRINITY_DN66972_c3_g1_i1:587-1987(-)
MQVKVVLLVLLTFQFVHAEQPVTFSSGGALSVSSGGVVQFPTSVFTSLDASWTPVRCVPLDIPLGSITMTFDKVGLYVTGITAATPASNQIKIGFYDNDAINNRPGNLIQAVPAFETSITPVSGDSTPVEAVVNPPVVTLEGTRYWLCAKFATFGTFVVAASSISGITRKNTALVATDTFGDPLPTDYGTVNTAIDSPVIPLLYARGISEKTVTPTPTATPTSSPTSTPSPTPTRSGTATTTRSPTRTSTSTSTRTPTAVPTGEPTLTPDLGSYQPAGIQAPPELKTSTWIDFNPKQVVVGGAFTLRLSGRLVNRREVYLKVARSTEFGDCFGNTPGGEPAMTEAQQADFKGIGAAADYIVCYKARNDWEPIGVLTVQAATPGQLLNGFTSCEGLITANTDYCGCYWGDGSKRNIVLPTSFNNGIITAVLSGWDVQQGCCADSQQQRVQITNTPAISGYCSAIPAP